MEGLEASPLWLAAYTASPVAMLKRGRWLRDAACSMQCAGDRRAILEAMIDIGIYQQQPVMSVLYRCGSGEQH